MPILKNLLMKRRASHLSMMLDNESNESFRAALAKSQEYTFRRFSGESILLNFSLVCPAAGSVWNPETTAVWGKRQFALAASCLLLGLAVCHSPGQKSSLW